MIMEINQPFEHLLDKSSGIEQTYQHEITKSKNVRYQSDILKVFEKISLSSYLLINKRLDDIRNLENNWDGYGAYHPSPLIISKTEKFISLLSHHNYLAYLDPDLIYPNPNGTITIEFETDTILISLEIGEKTANYFAQLNGEYHISENISNIENQIPHIFNRLLS